MKTKLIIPIIVAVLVLIPIQLVYAPPPAPDPEDDFRYSDHVITGKIISSEIIKDPREDNSAATFYDIIIYQVKVEEWHKNPLENDIITVYGTHFPNDVIPEPDWGVVEFEIGDTVYLYINETDDGLEFRKYASKLLQKYIAEESKGYPPPLKQIKSGVSIDEIQCKQNLTLVIKQNVSPACVKPETRTKLIERGWAIDEPEFFKTMYVELLHSFQHTQTQLALGDITEDEYRYLTKERYEQLQSLYNDVRNYDWENEDVNDYNYWFEGKLKFLNDLEAEYDRLQPFAEPEPHP